MRVQLESLGQKTNSTIDELKKEIDNLSITRDSQQNEIKMLNTKLQHMQLRRSQSKRTFANVDNQSENPDGSVD